MIVAGRDLTTLGDADLRAARRDIGMIFQHFNLLSSRTVYGNVAFPLELAGLPDAEIRARVEPLLDLVGLGSLRDRYPSQISGGQKQRVGIARALASRPKVLLSDEATSALDPETTRSILALLQKINRELGLTIVLITHQMQVVKQVADRVAVIEAGRFVEQGSVLEVFTRPQQVITRSLVDEILPQELPASVLDHVRQLQGHLSAAGAGTDGRLLERVQSLLSRRTRKARWTNCKLVLSQRSQFFHSRVRVLYALRVDDQERAAGVAPLSLAGRANLIFLKPAPAGCRPRAARSRSQSTSALCATWESRWVARATGNRCAADTALHRTPHTTPPCVGPSFYAHSQAGAGLLRTARA